MHVNVTGFRAVGELENQMILVRKIGRLLRNRLPRTGGRTFKPIEIVGVSQIIITNIFVAQCDDNNSVFAVLALFLVLSYVAFMLDCFCSILLYIKKLSIYFCNAIRSF